MHQVTDDAFYVQRSVVFVSILGNDRDRVPCELIPQGVKMELICNGINFLKNFFLVSLLLVENTVAVRANGEAENIFYSKTVILSSWTHE